MKGVNGLTRLLYVFANAVWDPVQSREQISTKTLEQCLLPSQATHT